MRPRLLLVTSRFPYPAIGGDRLRAFHLARLLSRRFRVTVLGLHREEPPDIGAFLHASGAAQARSFPLTRARAWRGALMALIDGRPLQIGYHESPELNREVLNELRGSDVLLCHLLRSSANWSGHAPGEQVVAVVDLCDAISNNYAQVVRGGSVWRPWSWISRIEGPRVRRMELQDIRRFDLVTFVSPADAASLNSPPSRTQIVTQGVDLERYPWRAPGDRRGTSLALIGKMDTYPNRTGALWFARAVLPLLPAGTRLKCIGDCPTWLRRDLQALPGVEVTGRVDDIAAACDDCFAGVAPLDIATGIQNKVLEYFALGLPAIVSPSVARGLMPGASDCRLVAETASQWVNSISSLTVDPVATHAMTERARRHVEAEHDWERIGRMLGDRLQSAVDMVRR